MIENKIREYLDKVEELKTIEKTISELIPDHLKEEQERLRKEVTSDKSVLQKAIKDGGTGIDVDGFSFKLSTRNRTSVSPDFMWTALELGHLEELIKIGAITDVKVNEDVIARLDPELAGIYSNLLVNKPYVALSWPKKADV